VKLVGRRTVRDSGETLTQHTAKLRSTQYRVRPVHTFFFAALALVSLLFAFGTPLYAILFYGLPGWDQLHSPFRWVFPFTVSMAVLGGVGLNVLLERGKERRAKNEEPLRATGLFQMDQARFRGSLFALRSLLFALLALAGLSVIVLVTASVVNPTPFITFGQRIVDGSDLAQMAFARWAHVLELPGRQSTALWPGRPARRSPALGNSSVAALSLLHPLTLSSCHFLPCLFSTSGWPMDASIRLRMWRCRRWLRRCAAGGALHQ
jgi:hypothetical protein